MIAEPLSRVLEATGYLVDGGPAAPSVWLSGSGPSYRRSDAREMDLQAVDEFATPLGPPPLRPDASWRRGAARNSNGSGGVADLTVFFKFAQRADGVVAGWQQEVWNLGFAPLLWVVLPDRTDIYNGFGRPQPPGSERANLLRTFGSTDEQLADLDAFAGRLTMETGRFWDRQTGVHRRTSVDIQLLDELAILERDLALADLGHREAQGLIGRTIFAKYLIDRKIVTNELLRELCGHEDLPEVLDNRDATKRVFDWLRDTFNGDMFPQSPGALPEARHLRRVARFLRAEDPVTGQLALFPYRFDVIPVELISSIYERFVHSAATVGEGEKPNSARTRGVYYTPLTAVSLVLDEVFDGLTGDEKVIDLTCGSGVFLVEALRRLVRMKANRTIPTRKMVREALYEQVYGVDISESAIQIAAFSLYLAALELDPDPYDSDSLRFEALVGRTLLAGDAHQIEDTVDGRRILMTSAGLQKFDVVVGNPPWTYGGRAGTVARRPATDGASRSPRGVSLDFVRRGMDFAHSETRFGVIVSARPFFSRSVKGLATVQGAVESLGSVTLVNLSETSNWLFPRANMPAMVLLARHRKDRRGSMELVQVRRSQEGDRSHTIGIASGDVTTLPVASWKRNQGLFKAAFLGCKQDLLLLDALWDRCVSLDERLHALGTGLASGLTTGDRSGDATSLWGLPFASRGAIDRFKVPRTLPAFEESAQWPRTRAIYRAPLLLVNQNVLREQKGILEGRLVAAVAEKDIVYKEAYLGVSFADAQPDIAYLVAGILCSTLASWYFLMTASNFGIWKRSIRVADLKALPAPDLEWAIGTDAGARIVGLVRQFHDLSPDDEDWLALDQAVFDLYELDEEEQIVANDGRLRATWQWKAGRDAAGKAADYNDLQGYARAFLLSMDAWLYAANERRFRAEVYDVNATAPLRVVRFILEDHPPPSRIVRIPGQDMSLRELLADVDTSLGMSIAEQLVGVRELRVHGRREVVIVKPAARRFWLGVTGLDDARSVMMESFKGGVE